MKRHDFIAKAVSELIDDGFSLKLMMEKSIDGKYGGWFGSEKDEKEFVVAMKHNCAFEIFVHEYSHYLQWKERRSFFNKKSKGCNILFDWLDGKKYSEKVISKAIQDTIELEWDCEQTAVRLIKKYKLDIDIDTYIRGANCYLFFYHTVHKLNKWTSNGRSPYTTAMRKITSNQLNELAYYLDEDNYDSKLRKHHESICKK